MLAAVFQGPNAIAVQQVPLSASKEVRLKVNACAVCGYDARVFRNGHSKVSPPVILGHELCGEVQETVRTRNGTIGAGSRVVVCPLVPCLGCTYCRSEHYNLCTNLREIGSTLDGGFAEYVGIPEQIVRIGGLVPVPDSLSDEEAALLEPLACCLNSFYRIGLAAKEGPVVIIGDGPLGLLHLQLFKSAGTKAAMVGKVPSRMEKAEAMGADAVFAYRDGVACDILDFAGEGGAKVAVVSTSSSDALELATKVVGKNSVINVFAGMPAGGQAIALDANWLHYNQVSITGTFSSTPPMLQKAAKMAAEKTVDLSKMVTHRYPLAEIEQAMVATEEYRGLRAVINRF